jgi:hypothetical protein
MKEEITKNVPVTITINCECVKEFGVLTRKKWGKNEKG